ncbi:hypothetical protein [Ramlibacter sp. WS9]|uniref:hypothetical protein n=1 Tax=Ramlibacter sp. WS9 TaxID=1882741 RepID=UPI001142A3F1|nr:hypothetical protein [Ramlibacter sp. WS9]
MRSRCPPTLLLQLLAASALLGPAVASAQGFAADYGLVRAGVSEVAPSAGYRGGALNLGGMRIAPVVQADAQFSGAGLSLAAGANWFAQVSVGRSVQYDSGLVEAMPAEALRIAGGYRWANGQALSLQVTGGRGPERLGLSVSYDWPRYFVRLSYDTGLNPLPQDKVRFSAGMRF